MEFASLSPKPHAVCIPLPFQSHINAMLKLAKVLHSQGFHITFANTEYNHNQILLSRGTNSLLSLPDFCFETISDGLPPPSDPHASPDVLQLLESITTKGSILAKEFIKTKATSSPPVSCIISDMSLISTLGAAEELISRNGNLEADVDFINAIHDFRLRDVPSFFWDGNLEAQKMLCMDLPKLSRVSAIILNTFETLEHEVLAAIKSLLPPIYPIGPLQMLEKHIPSQELRSFGSNLLKENQDCFHFLDSKPVNSVLYINFGSGAGLTRHQLIEFAWGLANSKHNFLWVVRPDLVIGGEDAEFPVEFMTEIDGRGMIITGWCPQEKVLCHSSTGGFLTHSGWNSMLDALCGGIPVVNWPCFFDQYTNCRSSCVHWGIGLQIDKDVNRCNVERIVKELMESEKGKEMKRKCMEWKMAAEESTKLDGSSCGNLQKFAEQFKKTTMDTSTLSQKPHAVCIPLPLQGHINVMLKLAKILHSKGFHITFANTEYNHNNILSSRGTDSILSLPDFCFETISNGLPPPSDPHAPPPVLPLLESITTKGSILAKEFISSKATSSPPVSCIISDFVLLSTLGSVEDPGIPQILLWPMCASTLILQLHGQEIMDKLSKHGDMEADVDFINGIHDFRFQDVPSSLWDGNLELQNMFYLDLQKISRASAIILNTFETLGFEDLEAIKSLLPQIYPIGPLHLLEQQIPNQELKSFGSNLLKDNQDCFQFLDSKPVNSVIYVSFGSGTKLTQQQLLEFAWGLANSKHNFLWVVRPDLVIGGEDDADFPVEFMTEIDGRGMIITGWCPQEKVLCHASVAGFLTHSGWNSMLDAICGGVPVVNWPCFGDQHTNCRNSCVHWGIGLQIDRDVKRFDVERTVKELMESEKGKEMKRKCMDWNMEAEESTKLDGSSCKNLQKFVEQFKGSSLVMP
ncbi:hypothetical protein ACHQM5_018667 [Ranunculus cassubicifolius]